MQSVLPLLPFAKRKFSDAPHDAEETEPLDEKPYASASPSAAASASRPRPGRTRLPRPDILLRRVLDSKWVLIALVAGLLLGKAHHSAGSSRSRGSAAPGRGEVREGVWEPVYGVHDLATVGTKLERPVGMPDCERTLLFDWAAFAWGFGSTTTTLLQAGFFARTQGYQLLVSRGSNAYGAYLDHFQPPAMNCWAREELYQPEYYFRLYDDGRKAAFPSHLLPAMEKGEQPQKDMHRLYVNMEDIYPLNHYARAATFDMPDLAHLPPLSSQHVLPEVIPDLFKQRFLQFSAVAGEHFALNPLMDARVAAMVAEYELDSPREVPTVGVHYRGGDKLIMECVPSAQLSCGNITLHCETALDSLSSVSHLFPNFHLESSRPHKPRLLLMTAESDALAAFQADAVCRRFEIIALGRGGSNRPFNQLEWLQLTAEDRLEDARLLIAQGDLLANWVDTTVVSANSNSARIMLVRAGPTRVIDERRIRSADIYWHPLQHPPFVGSCIGETPNCWPGDVYKED